ncbi:MAG: hypothetical protein CL474_02175 [Acidobacteria bacterium]|nr:hypothetical protein [Acidobacteriota bacterium]
MLIVTIHAHRALLFASLVIVTATLVGCGAPVLEESGTDSSRRIDVAALDTRINELLRVGHSDGMTASIWIGGVTGEPWYIRDASTVRAAASSIKTAYLVELFDAYAEQLDESVSELAEIVSDEAHPAVAHFSLDDLTEIRREVEEATIRRLGHMMIRGSDVSNVVYNASANVVTALLGGPGALTARIQRRDAAFSGLTVRRYMLAARDVTGDNEATAASLAAVLRRIASRRIAGMEPDTISAMWDILRVPNDDGIDGRVHYFKSGSLNSDPMVRIRSGFWHFPPDETTVYVVIVEQPVPGSLSRDRAGERLAGVSVLVTDAVLAAR